MHAPHSCLEIARKKILRIAERARRNRRSAQRAHGLVSHPFCNAVLTEDMLALVDYRVPDSSEADQAQTILNVSLVYEDVLWEALF